MAVPLRQGLRIGAYLAKQKIKRVEKFPLIVELEPLFACNLACEGCGKIQHPHDILKQRMPVEQAVAAIEESGAPMVSIAGGEPLMHPQIEVIAAELIKRKKYVYLCTNALLMPKKIDKFKPSQYFSWAVHIDGLEERHDHSVAKQGVFAQAVDAMEKVQTLGKPMAYRPPGARDGATQYALGNWCERWTAAGDCTLVSSPGAFGTFPWIDRTSGTYGIFFVDSRLPKVAAYFYQARTAILAQKP